jgi:hypothetical protein
MADEAAPELVAERLLEFYEALRGATAPPPRCPKAPQSEVKGAGIRIRRKPPPPTPEEVLSSAVAHLDQAGARPARPPDRQADERDPATAIPVKR